MKGVICLKIGLKNLGSRLQLLFSHTFDGIVWNTIVSGKSSLLLLEVRNADARRTSFSAFDFKTNRMILENISFDEPWWINLAAAVGDLALFTIYTETNNPDQKSLLAYQVTTKRILWWQNDFSLVSVAEGSVTGYSHKFGLKELTLSIGSGKVISAPIGQPLQNLNVIRPFHFKAEDTGFVTVRSYLTTVMKLDPVLGMDYLEADSFIFISCYVQEAGLANYLIVMTAEGDVVLNEKAGENLKGIGIDTFFLLQGSLFFVKNRSELVRYKVL